MKKILIIIFSVLFTIGCKQEKTIAETAVKEEFTPVNLPIVNIDSINSLVSDHLKMLITNLDSNDTTIDGEFIFSNNVLPSIFKSNQYDQLWDSKKNRTEAIDAIQGSSNEGLLPNDYHFVKIKKYADRYDELSVEEKAIFEILLTDGVLLYSYHLVEGKVNPENLSYSWNFIHYQLPENAKDQFLSAIKTETIAASINKLKPQDEEYQLLKKSYRYYSDLVSNNTAWEIVTLNKTLHPKENDVNLPLLRKRLIAENYLSELDTSGSTIYDSVLVAAVAQFQKQHGLNSDGIIGKSTLKALNITIKEIQQTILVNLERRKWIAYPSNDPYIKVNIASYKMQFIEDNRIAYQSRVVVGKLHKETPMFSDKLELIVLNPTWTLPFSIASTETLRKLKKDPQYLEKHNMVILNHNNEVVNSNGIDWNKYKTGHFPYTVRQQAGPSNALGRVKFLFPNKYSIYLHDTPSKSLFSKEKRAFSHGCIRLENPLDFATFLLKREDHDKWSRKKVNDIVKTNKTKNIRLKYYYPINLMYQTAAINEDGLLIIYPDIYSRDNKLHLLLTSSQTNEELIKSRLK